MSGLPTVATVEQGVRFALGLRRFLRDPVDLASASTSVAERWRTREARFLDNLDRTVWSHPDSPHQTLLAHAGVGRGDVMALVESRGLSGALEQLRDAGVYTSYEEYLGLVPARRGSASFSFSPERFLNPAVSADYMGSTSGTRSAGTAVGKSFRHLRVVAEGDLLHRWTWDVAGSPSAVWLPVLPSSAGLNNVLRLTISGDAPERWFSHVDPAEQGIGGPKRVANRMVTPLGRLLGQRLPSAEHVPVSTANVVLDWCVDALARTGRAFLVTYPTSAVALTRSARDRGVRLDGLVLRLGGEPATPAKLEVMRSSGATPANCYAFAQAGRVAMACPECDDEELHVLEQDAEVIVRRRDRGDGVAVDAYLWTSLEGSSPSVLLNVENDDYGSVRSAGCGCILGQLGMRTRIGRVRGMTKVVTGGITLGADVLERLAEEVLPRTIGGVPGDYQFSEEEHGGATRLIVRIGPRVGDVDEHQVVTTVERYLRESDLGILAQQVWRSTGTLRVTRESPVVTRSGKLLVFEPLRR